MQTTELKQRTKLFALRIIKLTMALPKNVVGDVIARQIIKSGTSIGANYRSACRAKSTADFINKIRVVEEEADETLFWLELIDLAGLVKKITFDRSYRRGKSIDSNIYFYW